MVLAAAGRREPMEPVRDQAEDPEKAVARRLVQDLNPEKMAARGLALEMNLEPV
jgi:hypothetical protein